MQNHAGHTGYKDDQHHRYLQRTCHILTNFGNTVSPGSYLLPLLTILHGKHPQIQYVQMFYSSLSRLKIKRAIWREDATTLPNEIVCLQCSLTYDVLIRINSRIDITHFTRWGSLRILWDCPRAQWLSPCCELPVGGVRWWKGNKRTEMRK